MRPIQKDEYTSVQNNLDLNSDLVRWIPQQLRDSFFIIKERKHQHPLFWSLLNPTKAGRLTRNLLVLEKYCDRFKRVLDKIIKDQENFYSGITEIEVMSYYYNKGLTVSYEPDVKAKTTKVDFKITNKYEYFFEIFDMNLDERIKKMNEIRLNIREKIDAIEINPFLVSFGITENFSVSDSDFLIKQIEIGIQKNIPGYVRSDVESIIDHQEIMKAGNINIGDYTLYSYKGTKGYTITSGAYVIQMKDDSRIKNNLLTKIDQIPEGERNIVVVNVTRIFDNDFWSLENAILGQEAAFVDPKTMVATYGRKTNGLFNHQRGNQISLIIAYKTDDFSTRKLYYNPKALHLIPDGEKNKF